MSFVLDKPGFVLLSCTSTRLQDIESVSLCVEKIRQRLLYFCRERTIMESVTLPEHPSAKEEYLHLQQARDTIDREIREVEALTGAKAGEEMDVHANIVPDD